MGNQQHGKAETNTATNIANALDFIGEPSFLLPDRRTYTKTGSLLVCRVVLPFVNQAGRTCFREECPIWQSTRDTDETTETMWSVQLPRWILVDDESTILVQGLKDRIMIGFDAWERKLRAANNNTLPVAKGHLVRNTPKKAA